MAGGGLLIMIVPISFVIGGFFLRRREQAVRPRRAAYLKEHDEARSAYNRARLIKWLSFPAVLLIYISVVMLWPEASENPFFEWPILGAGIGGMIYGSLAQTSIDEAANRTALGEPSPTPAAERKKALAIAIALTLAAGIFVADRLLPQLELIGWLTAATMIVVPVGVIVAAGIYIWRKTKKSTPAP